MEQKSRVVEMVVLCVWLWAGTCWKGGEGEGSSSATVMQEDGEVLLEMKRVLLEKNASMATELSSWSNGTNPCTWNRVSCRSSSSNNNNNNSSNNNNNNNSSSKSELMKLDLSGLNLSSIFLTSATLPFSDLRSLASLNLSGTSLPSSPSLSSSLANCSLLSSLDLSSNLLSGPLAPFLPSSCSSLTYLNASENSLSGPFPLSLLNCSSLRYLNLSKNNLSGHIPPQVGNLSSLEVIDLSENLFSGWLPSEFGSVRTLQVLMAGFNQLTGSIPAQLRSCKNLSLLDLNTNHLEGSVLDFLGEMSSLRYIVLHSNAFSGQIPLQLSGLSELQFLDLSNNSFSGSIPVEFESLTSLRFLLVAANNLSGHIPPELGNITTLQFLDLSSNKLTGSIPSSLGKLQNLLWLMLAFNALTGTIPHELGNCSSLLWLNVRSNSLSGQLPRELSSMGIAPEKTFTFNANASNFNPPVALGECLMLRRWIPENYPPYSFVYDTLSRNSCRSFWANLLTGAPLPPACENNSEVGGYIQVTDNMLTGSIPENLQGNRSTILLLGLNSFTGSLPSGLGKLLIALNVSHNKLSGSIPAALGDNKCLTLLDLSYNNLSGAIPSTIGGLNQLARFNVSYNSLLSGSVPPVGQLLTFSMSSYVNDSLLCLQILPGMRENVSVPAAQFCNSSSSPVSQTGSVVTTKKKISSKTLLVIGLFSCLGVLLCGVVGIYLVSKCPVHSAAASEFPFLEKSLDDSVSGKDSDAVISLFKGAGASSPHKTQLTYSDILFATSNFDESQILGRGGFGVVYKAKLPDGSTVAIKKLSHTGAQGQREFIAEMESLCDHVHENLVPLLGCGTYGGEKLLMYKFLSNGSLDDWLYEKEGGAEMLNWSRRLRIACGCAQALRYLHHDCSPVLIHRDMKASNILLDEDFNGYLTDFGLARELVPGDTHVSTVIAGTLGYVPPEYCQRWRATTKGDVYSFGMVLLELITGRKPLSSSDSNDGNLVEWVRGLLSESRAAEAYHPAVKSTAGENGEAELLEFLSLASACSRDHPDDRPDMQEVAKALKRLQQRRAALSSSNIAKRAQWEFE